MITQKKIYDTGVMGLNFGRHDEQRRRLADERRQEYNRMMAQKNEPEKKYNIPPTKNISRKDPMPLPKRPPSSVAAFGKPLAIPKPSIGASNSLFPEFNFSQNSYRPSLPNNDLNFERQNLEGALNQLQSILNPSSSTTSDLDFPPMPRFSTSADATLTSYEPPPLQSVLQQQFSPQRRTSFSAQERTGSFSYGAGFGNSNNRQLQENRNKNMNRNPLANASSYQPSAFDDSPRKRGQFDKLNDKQSSIEEYNPWGKGGAGAPIKDSAGNVISSRKYRHAGHHNQDPSQNGSDYYSDLKRQILEKKRKEEEEQRKMKEQDDKLAKRAEEQATRMKNEYEAEQAKHRRKEEELQKKQEMMRNIQEQQLKEDLRRKNELEEKRRIGRERMEEDNTAAKYLDSNRIKSPIIPTLRKRDSGPGLQSDPNDILAGNESNEENQLESREDALNTLSNVRQHLQARQQELQKDIEEQKKRYQDKQKSRNDFASDYSGFTGHQESFLKSAARIKSSIPNDSRLNKEPGDIHEKNRSRRRRLQRLQNEKIFMDDHEKDDDFEQD